MSEIKPIASLSPTLLARKGGAKPAMRPQLHSMQHFHEATARHLDEDLGFNDMGEGTDDLAFAAEVVSIIPGIAQSPLSVPEVVRQQKSIAARVAASAKQRRSALAEGRLAAFTLRLDADRHLKLRLACTLENRSAQQLVTEALDHLIAGMPDVATLAAQAGKRR